MDIIDRIRKRQAAMGQPRKGEPPEHHPSTLYIGCIDARLDPVADIGFPPGEALIHRTIGAVVAGLDERGNPRHLSEAASIEFAVKAMKVKHIVVSGHTCCGGMHACLHEKKNSPLAFLCEYLKPLALLRNAILGKHKDDAARELAMEQDAVRQSVDKLRTYSFVREAEQSGELQLHGLVLDTANKRIREMDPVTKDFNPMKAPAEQKHPMDRRRDAGFGPSV